MRIRSAICSVRVLAAALILAGLVLLLCSVPFWVFCAALAAVLIVIGVRLF